MKRVCVLAAALLAASLTVLSQEAEKRGVASKGKFNHKVRFTTTYDKFEDETTVKVDPRFSDDTMRVAGGLELIALFGFKGERLEEAVKNVTLRFESTSKEWRFLYNQTLIALVDGERVHLGEGGRISRIENPDYFGNSRVSERVYYVVDAETFNKIANGKVVEMKVGNKVIKLKDRQLEVLRDLASRMNPLP